MRFIKTCLLSLLLMLSYSQVIAQTKNLSNNSTISLLTVSPMSESVVSSFGHTALRIKDTDLGIDYIFNYGTFNTSMSSVKTMMEVFKGTLECEMWVSPFNEFYETTKNEDRTLVEHTLNLLPEEKELVWNSLLYKAKEENRKYIFDFFDENCTTFPRDLIMNDLGKRIILPDHLGQLTYREIINQYAGYNPWFQFVVDLISGTNIDKKASPFESLFIPQELEKAWLLSTIEEPDGSERQMIISSNVLYKRNDNSNNKILVTPLWFGLILLFVIVVISFIGLVKRKYFKWIDCVLFGITGLLGIVFYVFKIGYAPWYSQMDWMILWIHPLHLIAAIFMAIKPTSRYLLIYHIINCLIILFLVLGIFFLPQHYNMACIPLMLCLWIRSVTTIIRVFNK